MTQDDADLRLVVDGVTVRPIARAPDLVRFTLSGDARIVRLCSRSLVPAERDPSAGDLRRLGVSVRRISLRSPYLDLDIPSSDEALREGWHEPESGHRWTDGAALLPPDLLRGFSGPVEIGFHLTPVRLDYGAA